MTKVVLHGKLGRVVGRRIWYLAVSSVSEALRAIEANTGKLFSYLINHEAGQAPYRVLINREDWRSPEEIVYPLGNLRVINIIPVLGGSGNGGIWQILVGLALIAAAVALAPMTGGLSLKAVFSGVPGFFATVGVTLTLGGIAQLLTPSPKADFLNTERSENRPSYLFSGPINTTRQGNAIPVGYGFLRVGSQVISTSMTSEDLINSTTGGTL